jgi:hypothetical protein
MKIQFLVKHRNKSLQTLNVVLICVFLFFTCILTSQTKPIKSLGENVLGKKNQNPSLASKNLSDEDVSEEEKPKIQDYLIISHKNDTTFVDTTLTIQKDYKFNYLRKDNFGLIPFSNLGQTYNTLTYNFENTSLMPELGARARHFNYIEIEDVNYYRVPTPLTELFFRTAFEQGQLVDSFFTVNTSPQFNFSVAYKGLRSLGKYQHILTSTGNFRVTGNYNTENGKYAAKGHIVTQDLMNQENGGLRDESIENFESGDPEFIERSILEVNFEDAESILLGKRYHLNHDYKIIKSNDSIAKNSLDVRHIFSYETKYFQYVQSSAQTSIFGDAFVTSGLSDKVTLKTMYNQLQLNYGNNLLGNFQFNASHDRYNYGYNRLVSLNGQTITNRLKGAVVAVGGKYHKFYKGFEINGDVGVNISGDFQGNYIKGDASIKLTDDIKASALINHSSKVPNYNAILYQSNYINYNWQNKLNNTETQQIAFKLESEKIANISVDFSTINNYVYFKEDENTNQVAAFQNNNTINYLRLRLQKEIKVGKFALNATVEYQNVKDKDTVLNVPEFNTRTSLYFSSHLFNKAMFLQTGVTLNYFTKYYMNAYNPVLAEFYVQKERQFGEFPRLDLFLNAKIRQTRLYLKAEHLNSAFTGYNYYASPRNPYRDFILRFGVVWNFFL